MSDAQYWVYILLCNNGHYYTGYTIDLERRYKEHVKGTSQCKYTRSFKPLSLAQSWQMNSKREAMKLESFIKKLSRKKKEQFIRYPADLKKIFSAKNPA